MTDMNIPLTSMSTMLPANQPTSADVTKGAMIVDVVVMSTERATSPPAMSVIRLLEVPPGLHSGVS